MNIADLRVEYKRGELDEDMPTPIRSRNFHFGGTKRTLRRYARPTQ